MLSKFLRERLSEFLSEEALNSLGNPLPQAIRVNTLKISEKELVSRLEEKGVKLEKIPWVRHGYYVKKAPFSIGATPEYLLGYYFLQDPTSMYTCEVLEPKGLVLDMAAAPGGKTTYLSQLMENKGCIIAIEINKARIKALKSNINRMNAENVITIRMDAREVESLGLKFDRILLDAPCTGTGTMHKSKEAMKKTKRDVEKCTALQREMLKASIKVLKKNAILVYCTCSLLPEENEFMVAKALEEGLTLEEIEHGEEALTYCYGAKLPRELKRARRFYPWHKTQGFFIAKLRKR